MFVLRENICFQIYVNVSNARNRNNNFPENENKIKLVHKNHHETLSL